ncbi:MAG: Wzt carbohydrate-binding domain-containing protein, partial [Anaerolineaceae bacterium]
AHLEPEILVVDEVLAVGDAQFQKKCLGKMSDVAGEGRTVLFVSHNMGMVNILTATCCWLQNGQVELLDSTEQVVSKYLDSTAQQSVIADSASATITIDTIVLKQEEELRSSGLIDFGLPFEIEVVLESKVDSDDAHFLFAIVSGDGNRFATMNSSDANFGVDLKSGEKYIVRWKCVENCLVPGRYYLEFNVHDRYRAAIARYENIATLEITSLGAPVRLARNTLRAGYIALPSKWYIQAI